MKYYSYKDLVRHFGKSVRTIERWLRRHQIKRQRPTARSVFISASELRRLERDRERKSVF